MMKGLSFNVTLSQEQIEEIAALTADKVQYTKSKVQDNEEYYIQEIEQLKRRIDKLNQIIVGKEINLEQYQKALSKWRDIADKYKEKYGELE